MQKNVYCKYTRDVIVGGATLLTFFNWQPPSDLSSAKNAAAHEHATNELSYFQWAGGAEVTRFLEHATGAQLFRCGWFKL